MTEGPILSNFLALYCSVPDPKVKEQTFPYFMPLWLPPLLQDTATPSLAQLQESMRNE